jgi:hypothetical protein
MVQLGAVIFRSPFLFISSASGTIKAQCQMNSASRPVNVVRYMSGPYEGHRDTQKIFTVL